jgi:hypothetical protein
VLTFAPIIQQRWVLSYVSGQNKEQNSEVVALYSLLQKSTVTEQRKCLNVDLLDFNNACTWDWISPKFAKCLFFRTLCLGSISWIHEYCLWWNAVQWKECNKCDAAVNIIQVSRYHHSEFTGVFGVFIQFSWWATLGYSTSIVLEEFLIIWELHSYEVLCW